MIRVCVCVCVWILSKRLVAYYWTLVLCIFVIFVFRCSAHRSELIARTGKQFQVSVCVSVCVPVSVSVSVSVLHFSKSVFPMFCVKYA